MTNVLAEADQSCKNISIKNYILLVVFFCKSHILTMRPNTYQAFLVPKKSPHASLNGGSSDKDEIQSDVITKSSEAGRLK